jgi:hypothetical protein
MSSALLRLAETTEHSSSSISPYAVGGIVLGFLLFLLVVLLMFGKGRDHS